MIMRMVILIMWRNGVIIFSDLQLQVIAKTIKIILEAKSEKEEANTELNLILTAIFTFNISSTILLYIWGGGGLGSIVGESGGPCLYYSYFM